MKETKITSSFSHLPAYRLWVASIFSMTVPPLLGMFSIDFSKMGDATERLIFFCGYYVKLIEMSHVLNKITALIGYRAGNILAIALIFGIIAMWFVILALPAFNQYSLKKRLRLHVIQFVYASIQAAAGYLFLTERYG